MGKYSACQYWEVHTVVTIFQRVTERWCLSHQAPDVIWSSVSADYTDTTSICTEPYLFNTLQPSESFYFTSKFYKIAKVAAESIEPTVAVMKTDVDWFNSQHVTMWHRVTNSHPPFCINPWIAMHLQLADQANKRVSFILPEYKGSFFSFFFKLCFLENRGSLIFGSWK
jgi:hypothetical protein